MPFKSTKTNNLRRLSNDCFVLYSSEREDALCRACASYEHCPIRLSADYIESCDKFIPIFVFVDATNLDKPHFNTMRIGQAWYNRLRVGSDVGLWDKMREIMTIATVTAIDWSIDKDEMIAQHGRHNHLGMTLDNPEADLAKLLQRFNGKGFYNNAKGLTVIYLSVNDQIKD